MSKQKIFSIGLFWVFTLFFIGNGYTATIKANGCTQSGVQEAVNKAVTGDTVSVPAGNCTWLTSVSIPSSKKIVLLGAGMNSTVIMISGIAIDMTTSGSRVIGFGFVGGGLVVDGDGWRIDHCKFYSHSFFTAIQARGTRVGLHPTGLVDNCSFHNGRVLVVLGAMLGERNDQHQIWAKPLNLGSTDNTVFVEDCMFTFTVFGNAIDANYGGGYVFRYNTLVNLGISPNQGAYIEAHSVQGNNRSARKWEVYGNIINNTGGSIFTPFRLRGGTGTVFYNSVIGNWTYNTITLDNVRNTSDYNDNTSGGGRCDGDDAWDGNADATGWPCRDQIGRGGDAILWTHSPPGAYTQTSSPAYMWLNRKEANAEVPVLVMTHSINHIVANRDFYSYNKAFDGTTAHNGMGCGTLGNRPAVCVVGQGYWATVQPCNSLAGMTGPNPLTSISGILYKCTAPNTWTKYYTPYTYPHPLRKPYPPQNMRISN